MNRVSRWIGALVVLLLLSTTGCDLVDQARHDLSQPSASSAQATPQANSPTAGATPGPGTTAQQPSARPTQTSQANGRAVGSSGTVLSVSDVAKRVSPAVVQVVTEQGAGRVSPLGLRDVQTGIGSGVIFDPKGYILTNNHVVANANTIGVALSDGRTFDAKLVGADPDTDLAVIQIQGSNLPVAELGDSDRLSVGDGVVAIGNALGLPGGATVTAGVVSALGRTVQEPTDQQGPMQGQGEPGAVLYDAIQTGAAINPGNSGGPLVNLQGQVIGINTLVASMAEPGVPAQGIGFAIAINTAKPIADQLVSTGHAVHPYIGILFQWAGATAILQRNANKQEGVLVQQVVSGSPAAKAGLQRGDVITKIDGQDIKDEATLPKTIQKHKPGDTVQLTVERDNQERTIQVTLAQ